MSFVSRLATRHQTIGNKICLGIDPPFRGEVLAELPFFDQAWRSDPLAFLTAFADASVDAATDRVGMVKYQSAFFEAFGHAGVRVLETSVKKAKDAGLLVLLDAKRGDISTTMHAYGHMAFENLGADAMTVTPYMGEDVFQPLLPWLQQDKGIYVVWSTSNPGAAKFQEVKLANETTIAELVFDQCESWFNQQGCAESLGFVLGATRFGTLPPTLVPKLARHSVLMPGIGPQGGTFSDELLTFTRSCPAAVIPMSRGLTGLGDPGQSEALQSINQWSSYRDYIAERISMASPKVPC